MNFGSRVGKALAVMLLGALLPLGCSDEEETLPAEEPNVGPGVAAPAAPPSRAAAQKAAAAAKSEATKK